MRFFFYEIVARIVAMYLCVDCSRRLWRGISERKIGYFNPDLLDWLQRGEIYRDAAPVRYWIEIGIRATLVVACAFVTVFGWWQPNS